MAMKSKLLKLWKMYYQRLDLHPKTKAMAQRVWTQSTNSIRVEFLGR